MAGRTERVSTERRDWRNLKSVLPFLWEYRGRALFALLCLITSKVAMVGVPVVLKDLVDACRGYYAIAAGLLEKRTVEICPAELSMTNAGKGENIDGKTS